MKKRRPTYAALQAEIKALKAQSPVHLKSAYAELEKCNVARYMASGLIVTITNLSGVEVVTPFMCQDGLEADTIKALQSQIRKTQAITDSYSLKPAKTGA